jgi:hypothetical protein
MQKIKAILLVCFVSALFIEAQCQTIFSNDNKYGIIDNESKNLVVPAIYDEIKVHYKPPWENPRTDTRIYILKQGDKYTYAMKQFWKTTYFHMQTWEEIDSVKWFIDSIYFEELFPLGVYFGKSKYGKIYQGDTCLRLEQDYYALGYRKNGRRGLITYIRNSKLLYDIHINEQGQNLDKRAIRFSLEDIKIYPANYDHVFSLDKELVGFVSDNKYGFINLKDGYEIPPEFDDVLVPLKYERYYYANKNGLWGVIYLNKYSSDYVVSIPFRYTKIDDIARNLQCVNFYEKRTFKEGEGLGTQLQNKYTACLYQSGKDVPFQLEFIIYDGETFSPTVRNVETNKQELNKEYIPPTERHVTLTPLINNTPVAQQERSEFICIHKEKQHVDDTSSLFFILKRDRLWDRNDNHYTNEKTEANAIYVYWYDFSKDSFVSVYDFAEESENINYTIIVECREFNCNFILKSTSLENEKYKHTFFTFDGSKIYEITSNYPINYWKFPQRDPNRTSSYIPDEDFSLEFYTEIPGKKNLKRKIVCNYNVKTKEFYK